MDRRRFVIKSSALGASALLAQNSALSKPNLNDDLLLLKPQSLQKGDTVGLITPASAAKREAFEKAVDNLEKLSFRVKYSENMNVRKGFLAGTDQQRLDDIHRMFEDPDVKGVICVRGGYGSGRLLNGINYELIKSNPKVLIGYSDITALLQAVMVKTGLVCFHGPVGASDFSDFTTRSFDSILLKAKSPKFSRPKSWLSLTDQAYEHVVINGGVTEGRLIGGNLSLICSLMGTPYEPDFRDKILFIEEVGESPYRVDRMLTQLINSGKLKSCAGLALGVFKGCETRPDDPDFAFSTSLKDVVLDRLRGVGIPAVYGLPIGHIEDNLTLPLGISASLDADKCELKLLEPAVV